VADEGSSLPSPAKRGPSKELSARVVSGIVMIAVALLAAYQGGWLFALFWLAAGIAMMAEWTNMTGVEPRRPVQVVFGLGLAALTVLLLTDAGFRATVACALAFLAVGSLLAQGTNRRLWAASGFVYAAVIVLVPPIVRAHPNLGLVGLLWMFAVVWTTDVTAYFVGRRVGGPKLWARVSPKKTWSGFAGGFVGGIGAGLLVALIAQRLGWVPVMSLPLVVILSGIASLVSQAGDLAESALKRRFDVKDSSRLIPGHGGVMDRLDGFFAVAVLVGAVLLAARIAAA